VRHVAQYLTREYRFAKLPVSLLYTK